MADAAIAMIIFFSITVWVTFPKWLRYKQELARETLKARPKDPQEQGDVLKLRQRVENLENLICRLDTEINSQLEQSLTLGRIVTTPSALGNSQMPTTFMNVASALESRYQVLKELGRGGMGIVFQAYDKALKEQVAIKILSPLLSNNPDALERLKREVSNARRITHPNVIRIHDISEISGLHFVSMEFFQGVQLKDFIKTASSLSVTQAFQIAGQICDGLEAAHRQGVIHRDLKSQNIIINSANQIKIIDFGLAHSTHLQGMTATGLIMGTPEYMAPEQVEGKRVDERADIYSVGIILYELFTGRVPFSGDSAIAIGFKQMKDDPPPPRSIAPHVSPEIEGIILRCLNKDPLARYPTITELKQHLDDASARKPLQSVGQTDRFKRSELEKIQNK